MNLRLSLFFFFFLIVNSTQLWGQNKFKKIDSLNTIAKELTDFNASNIMLDKIIQEANKVNYKLGLVTAVITKGVNYHNHSKFEEAIKLTNDWEQIVLSTDDCVKISHLYGLRANSYGRLFFYEKSMQCLKDATFYAQKIKDDDLRFLSIGRIYGVMAINFKDRFSVPAHLDSMLYYRQKSYQINRKIKGVGDINIGSVIQLNGIGRIYLAKNNFDSAQYYFDESLRVIKKNKIDKFIAEPYMGIGDVHFHYKRLDSALIYYQKSLAVSLLTKNLINIKDNYQKLSAVYEQLGDMSKSYEFLKKYGALADSMALQNKMAVKVSSDIILKEKDVQFKRKSSDYTIVITGVVTLLVALGYALFAFSKLHQKTIAIHKVKQEHLIEKLEFLKTQTLTDKVDDQVLKEIISLAMSNDPAFLIKFQEYHPIFIQKLMERAPSLVTSDLLICAQLRLGFYTKEIARYTRLSVRAIEGKKYRIRKKLAIPASEDINVWMMQV